MENPSPRKHINFLKVMYFPQRSYNTDNSKHSVYFTCITLTILKTRLELQDIGLTLFLKVLNSFDCMASRQVRIDRK